MKYGFDEEKNKINLEEMFKYQVGDTYSIGDGGSSLIVPGIVSRGTSAYEIQFSITLPKTLENIDNVTIDDYLNIAGNVDGYNTGFVVDEETAYTSKSAGIREPNVLYFIVKVSLDYIDADRTENFITQTYAKKIVALNIQKLGVTFN